MADWGPSSPMTEPNAHTIAVHDCEPAIETMRDDVLRGLAQDPKMLPSQYLYDERGARLFESIGKTEEYHLTCPHRWYHFSC
jgi:uncharacterized SAM-dependent methyltransferase